MPGDAGGVIYSVDTNALMDWQARYYPTDVFGVYRCVLQHLWS
jgi:hypothetical protein